jgi:hypothetical protein
MVAAVGEVEERVYEHGGQLDERVILQDAARYPASERSALWDTRQRESLLYRPTIAGSASSSRLLKKSLRLRNEECKRDFLRLDAAQVRSFGVKSGRCSLALHVAGRASPLGAKSLGRRTML